jgi:hypothetical protein
MTEIGLCQKIVAFTSHIFADLSNLRGPRKMKQLRVYVTQAMPWKEKEEFIFTYSMALLPSLPAFLPFESLFSLHPLQNDAS